MTIERHPHPTTTTPIAPMTPERAPRRRAVTAPLAPIPRPATSPAARLLARIDHPAAVSDAALPADTSPWDQFLDGAGASPAGLDWHLLVLVQLCHLIEHAHRRGVVHHDLRPAQVLVGQLGTVSLRGWARAGQIGTPVSPLTPDDPLAFTAPERFEATPGAPAADVFGLGACLHWVLTGRGPNAAPDRERQRRRSRRTETLRYAPHTPAGLVAVCRRALATHPDDRFPSVGALRRAIEVAMAERHTIDALSEAQQRLDALRRALSRGAVNDPGFDEAFGRCRALFEQARRARPDAPAATDGLQALHELAIMRAINQQQWDRAEALLDALPRPRIDLAQVLERQAAQARAQHSEQPSPVARRGLRLVLAAVGLLGR